MSTLHYCSLSTGRGATSKQLHQLIMKALQNNDLDPQNPRADAQILFKQLKDNALIIQARDDAEFTSSALEVVRTEQVTFPESQQRFTLFGRVSRLYQPKQSISKQELEMLKFMGFDSPPSTPGGSTRKVPIPEEELVERFTGRFTNMGFTLHNIDAHCTDDLKIDHKRNNRIPTAEIKVTLSGDAQICRELIVNGLGKGKNYGLGLLLVESLH